MVCESIQQIIKICGFEEDPLFHKWKGIFEGASINYYDKILKNRDDLIKNLILNKDSYLINIKENAENTDLFKISNDSKFIEVLKPVLLTKGAYFPEQNVVIYGKNVFLDKGVKLTNSTIGCDAYISENVVIEYSHLQSDSRKSFIGDNTVVSNVSELRGCIISGGPLDENKPRKRIWLHAKSINNVIMGAYVGASVGFEVMNHPLGSDFSEVVFPKINGKNEHFTRIYDDLNRKNDFRKLPIFIGCESIIGAQALLNSGSIIGKGFKVPNKYEIKGLYYNKKS